MKLPAALSLDSLHAGFNVYLFNRIGRHAHGGRAARIQRMPPVIFTLGVTSMPLSASIRFESQRFDYMSQLPEEYNAGNRFYGRDVAEFLSSNLTAQGLDSDFLDEDWGWLLCSLKGVSPEFEVAIYNLAEHGEGDKPGVPEWGLWIQAYERKKLLGLFPKRSAIAVPSGLLSAVQAAVRAAGSEPSAWEDGPGDA